MYKFSKRSKKNLKQVHPDLVKVMKAAIKITPIDFGIIEGLRTYERQEKLYATGASWTMKSKHLANADGLSEAVDIAAFVDGQLRWDWPLYDQLAVVIKQVAEDLGIKIIWGGDWLKYRDGPHYQLA